MRNAHVYTWAFLHILECYGSPSPKEPIAVSSRFLCVINIQSYNNQLKPTRRWDITATQIMKKSLFFVLMASVILGFVSCEQDVDPRDNFVGTYSFTQTGSATIHVNGVSAGSIPMNASGIMNCTKIGTGNQVKLTGDILADVDGTVSGNTLILNPTTVNENSNGVSMQLTFNYQPAVKNGNTVTCIANINGIANAQGVSGTISESITLVAIKQ